MHQLQEKQRIATAEQSDDADVFGYHFEDGSLAVNLFHMRAGKIVDRREFFWEDLPDLLEASAADGRRSGEQTATGRKRATLLRCRSTRARSSLPCSSSSTLTSSMCRARFLCLLTSTTARHWRHLLSERTGHRIELAVPQRGEKRSLVDLASQNAKQSYTQRFRVLEPSRKAIQEALADALMLPELPRRIECFDISHIQGAETVASLVVWEDGKMNKSAYRKFKVKTVRAWTILRRCARWWSGAIAD